MGEPHCKVISFKRTLALVSQPNERKWRGTFCLAVAAPLHNKWHLPRLLQEYEEAAFLSSQTTKRQGSLLEPQNDCRRLVGDWQDHSQLQANRVLLEAAAHDAQP